MIMWLIPQHMYQLYKRRYLGVSCQDSLSKQHCQRRRRLSKKCDIMCIAKRLQQCHLYSTQDGTSYNLYCHLYYMSVKHRRIHHISRRRHHNMNHQHIQDLLSRNQYLMVIVKHHYKVHMHCYSSAHIRSNQTHFNLTQDTLRYQSLYDNNKNAQLKYCKYHMVHIRWVRWNQET